MDETKRGAEDPFARLGSVAKEELRGLGPVDYSRLRAGAWRQGPWHRGASSRLRAMIGMAAALAVGIGLGAALATGLGPLPALGAERARARAPAMAETAEAATNAAPRAAILARAEAGSAVLSEEMDFFVAELLAEPGSEYAALAIEWE